MTRLFSIEEYYLTPKLICVTLDDEREITINREEFERWLEDSSRLEYSSVLPDHTGEPKEVEGIISIHDYWDVWDAHNDLYDYILLKKVVDPFDIKDSLNTILNDFSPSND